MRARRTKNDDGVVMVFVALLLVFLMVMGAFAVDIASVFAARRQDQNAADSGALGGAQELTSGTGTTTVDQVRSLVHATVGTTFSDAEWNSCTLEADFAAVVHGSIGVQNCIQKTSDGRRLLVKLPMQRIDSIFGSVAGIVDYEHTAFAIAGFRSDGFGGILPFGLPGGAGGGDGLICMKDAPGGLSIPPCNGPDSGNFQYLDFKYFGSAELGTTRTCTGHENDRLANNMAVGVDHELSKFTATVVDEGAECPKSAPGKPNTLFTESGNKNSAFGDGIYSGSAFSDGKPARLQRLDGRLFSGLGETATVGGHTLDDNPLWEFIDPAMESKWDLNGSGTDDVPSSCERDVFTDVLAAPVGLANVGHSGYAKLPTSPVNVRTYVANQANKAQQMRILLQRCFQHYNGEEFNPNGNTFTPDGEVTECAASGCTSPVFARNSVVESPDLYDIQLTSRFGYVPELLQTSYSGKTLVNITTFRAIFLQRLLGECNGNSCGIDYEPGVPIVANTGSATKASAVTAFTFPKTMLPNGLADENAPFALGKNRFIELLR